MIFTLEIPILYLKNYNTFIINEIKKIYKSVAKSGFITEVPGY